MAQGPLHDRNHACHSLVAHELAASNLSNFSPVLDLYVVLKCGRQMGQAIANISQRGVGYSRTHVRGRKLVATDIRPASVAENVIEVRRRITICMS